jgi:hypothetical protein
MYEFSINYDLESPQEKGTKIIISVTEKTEALVKEKFSYKFIIGKDGTWDILRDFSDSESTEWTPAEDGKYIIMIQAKKADSNKPFDYMAKENYIIGKSEKKIINNVFFDKTDLSVGDKLSVTVNTNTVPLMYRYWIKETESWVLVKDYCADSNLVWSLKNPGDHELIVECRTIDSKNLFDDFMKVPYKVNGRGKIEIRDFKCLSPTLIVNMELIFQIESSFEDSRTVLYKFIKINEDGTSKIIQDYSTRRMVTFIESKYGNYKLLCLVKDMYSTDEYDDRAVLNYTVLKYKPIEIQSFTSDLNSPQVCDEIINLKAVVKGGSELQYRFIIENKNVEDSGYIRQNSYEWKPKEVGRYKVNVWVKDSSFEDNYEKCSNFEFVINEKGDGTVKIDGVSYDKSGNIVKNDTIKVIVSATGGLDLRYSFMVLRDEKEIEKINYGTCNWVNYTPDKEGSYDIEIRVKDKYSNREYDCHEIIHFDVCDFIPSKIDYILLPYKETRIVDEPVFLDVITRNTQNTLVKYILSVNKRKVEEIDFSKSKKYAFTPKYSGTYTVDIFSKNILSKEEFDYSKEVIIQVSEAIPITSTKISCSQVDIISGKPVTFTVNCEGGREVLYEFYLMEHGEWNLVQNYSRKNDYTFIPFHPGEYKILVLDKSSHKKRSYEDFDLLIFNSN